jgi:ferrous iron transport protein A
LTPGELQTNGNRIYKAGSQRGFRMSVLTPADLGAAPRGFRGRILGLRLPTSGALAPDELERRLIELGFVAGAMVEILHEGLFGRDPIAIRLQSATIALRRREAAAILVEPLS